MDSIRIRGGIPLKGTIPISGAKNAALPLMAATLLSAETLTLRNLPHLVDIATMANLLASHGVALHMKGDGGEGCGGRVLDLTTAKITDTTAHYDLVRKMRASILVLGPLLAREGRARVSLPGGCAIGARPVDLHLKALEQMGATISIDGGYVDARVEGRLKGAHLVFPQVTVTGTENLLMAATLADGETIIDNAAREPEVGDLAECLIAMGAEIEGVGTARLVVRGKDALHGAVHSVLPDRIEAGSYAVAAAITRGKVLLEGADPAQMAALVKVLIAAGVHVEPQAGGLLVDAEGRAIKGVDVMTEPHPGFPTDMQAQVMALFATAEGAAMMTETIFENRFMHVPELKRMGADINIHNNSAIVRGVARLSGAPVMATDLRASMSLVLAALAASGETTIARVYHLDRGYERLEQKLAACGAEIERLRG
ncbi:UDP-N-acetylglucosamine 1-carboxyvinyltransferase [uncultured Alphaproteobacteria bacterium]|uniref:UDP-N-acetylglucosamine 1-carboxyvinyltransferase n=1 Tax=uncultured Alphaproteobacteria bacterium TaxID=91750 RepID=A0A212KM34_9PROT|nr:UDP-N-acetylglucosamine 1-carboxyvinyltransferase [uncultured Alphaproteobacteria bacterium]